MSKETILIVDDTLSVGEALQGLLKAEGYNIMFAADGADAVTLATEQSVNLILLDYQLPALNGLEVVRELRRRGVQTAVIAMTAYANYETATEFIRAGACDFIAKPINPESLLHQIKRVLILEAAGADLQSTHDELAALRKKYESLKRQNVFSENERQLKKPKCFIVHGHDHPAKLELKNYLQNTLLLGEPTILQEKPSRGKTIIEKFEAEACDTNLAFILLTPDDLMSSDGSASLPSRRARQNVIFELGYFIGRLRRQSGCVFLLTKGNVDLPSDLSGVVYIDISGGIASAGEELRRELGPWIGEDLK
jgi:predicted nucleotide-binding protein